MKAVRLLIVTTAFLLMLSSIFSVMTASNRTPVYINIAGIICLAVAVSLLNFYGNKNKPEDNK
ncbi:MAG: hypothetical protein ACRDDZ_03060 [Marinifilaceae bacterium]